MPTLFLPLLERIMAGEGPPEVPRRVVSRARFFGHVIANARSQSTIAALCGQLYVVEDGRFVLLVNRRWIVTFAWENGLGHAHALELEQV